MKKNQCIEGNEFTIEYIITYDLNLLIKIGEN